MNSVELLEEAVDAARRVGFQVREEWFGGSGGGACAVRGQKLLFLDLNLARASDFSKSWTRCAAIRKPPKSS